MKANNRRKATSSNFYLFLSKAQKQDSTWKLRFSFGQIIHNVNRSSCSTDCAAEDSKPRVMLQDQLGDHPLASKIEKISISRAIRLRFLRSPVSAIQCKAIKSNRRREEGLIGSRALKMLRDLRWRARGLAHHAAAANARAEVRARMHNGWI